MLILYFEAYEGGETEDRHSQKTEAESAVSEETRASLRVIAVKVDYEEEAFERERNQEQVQLSRRERLQFELPSLDCRHLELLLLHHELVVVEQEHKIHLPSVNPGRSASEKHYESQPVARLQIAALRSKSTYCGL